MFKCAELKR